MKIFSILKNIYTHPMNRDARFGALVKFFRWQLFSRILPHPVVFPFVEKSVLVIENGMTGATGNIYNGLHEHNDMLFTLHFLRTDDLFVDIGANIGSYTILAAVNGGARVISFEPVPRTFEYLKRNVLVNDVADRVELINKAAANQEKKLFFTADLDAANHAVPESNCDAESEVLITCTTLDIAIANTPDLMKIDVEGFETEVIQGGERILKNPKLKAIIIELNGSGKRYGFDEEAIHQRLLSYGFSPHAYNPFSRELKIMQHWGTHNSIYIRDFDFVKERIKSAPKFRINNQNV